jgi:hypothetical protein
VRGWSCGTSVRRDSSATNWRVKPPIALDIVVF